MLDMDMITMNKNEQRIR